MNPSIWILLYVAAFIGHASFWIGLFNRMHGTSLNNRLIRRSSYPITALGLFILPITLYAISSSLDQSFELFPDSPKKLGSIFGLYTILCWAMFLIATWMWVFRNLIRSLARSNLINASSTSISFRPEATESDRNRTELFFASIPGNQIYDCVIEDREIRVPQIAKAFDGLSITHLTDFHLTGNICQAYFDCIIEKANSLESDLVVLTGDFIDNKDCWDWLADTLGKLQAPLGVFYILGNHDQRIGDEAGLRSTLDELGLISVAKGWQSIPRSGQTIHLAGNELPWFGKEVELPLEPPGFQSGDFRLLLSHSPDQWSWATDRKFDLMVAGHTHGGQIRIPLLGPIICPSKYGVKFASGVFSKGNQTMVVSRGISGEEPVRFFCPPEIGRITIRSQ